MPLTVRPFLLKFEALDVTRTGRLEKADLAHMVQLNRESKCAACIQRRVRTKLAAKDGA